MLPFGTRFSKRKLLRDKTQCDSAFADLEATVGFRAR
jgi:hypothetical protein